MYFLNFLATSTFHELLNIYSWFDLSYSQSMNTNIIHPNKPIQDRFLPPFLIAKKTKEKVEEQKNPFYS